MLEYQVTKYVSIAKETLDKEYESVPSANYNAVIMGYMTAMCLSKADDLDVYSVWLDKIRTILDTIKPKRGCFTHLNPEMVNFKIEDFSYIVIGHLIMTKKLKLSLDVDKINKELLPIGDSDLLTGIIPTKNVAEYLTKKYEHHVLGVWLKENMEILI